MKSKETPATQTSGIETSASGERHIPKSVRADGSVRREIRIRPGYKPPEDVEVYKNRTAEAWKDRGTGGVPGAESIVGANDRETSSAGKNAKRREARKKAKALGGHDDSDKLEEQVDMRSTAVPADSTTIDLQPNAQEKPAHKLGDSPAAVESVDHTAENEKQARNLRKKLRQAKELKDKKDSGASLLPEQFAKVIKIQELVRQLDALGFPGEETEASGANLVTNNTK